MKSKIIVALFTAGLSGCAPTIDNRGYETENVDFSKIQVGVHTTDQVHALLGSPSTVSPFPPQTWYYISKVTSTTSFMKPVDLEQKTLAIIFDNNGIVKSIEASDGENIRKITPVKRETQTAGYQTGVLREIFSNFGRISAKDKPAE